MGDLLGFLGTIFAIVSGGTEVVSEVVSSAEEWCEIQWRKAERKFVPAFAKVSRGAIVCTAVIMIAAVLGSAFLLSPDHPLRFFADHLWTTVFLVFTFGALAFRREDLGAAIARARPLTGNDEDDYEPDTLGEGDEAAPNPLAGQRRINERTFRPQQLKLPKTTLLVTFALLGTAFSLYGMACTEHNALVAVIATALCFFVIAAHRLLAKSGAWLGSKGTLAGAFAANIGFLQATPLLYGVTKDNVERFISLKGFETRELLEWVDAQFNKVLAPVALLASVIITWPSRGVAYALIVIAAIIFSAGIYNAHHNPLDEKKLQADFARRYRRAILWIAAATIIIWPALPFEWRTGLSSVWDRWNAILLGKTCVPIEADWWAFIGFGLLALVSVKAFKSLPKKPDKPEDSESDWLRRVGTGIIGVFIALTSITSLWEAVEIIGTKAGKERHMAFCSPIGKRPTFTKDWKTAEESPTVLTRTEERSAEQLEVPRQSIQIRRRAPKRTVREAVPAYDSRPVPEYADLQRRMSQM